MTNFILREYQQDVIDRIRRHWEDGHTKVIVALPTGGGKTETSLAIMGAERSSGGRCLVIVDRLVLCQQWIKRMHKHGMTDTGILQGTNTTRVDEAAFVIATAQTIASRGIKHGEFNLIVIDECHYWHGSHQKIVKALDSSVRVIGLSATPLNRSMVECFDTVVAPTSIRELIANGHLVPSKVFVPGGGEQIKRTLKNVAVSQGDFKVGELDTAMRGTEIMGNVITTWQRLGEDRPTIAFCVSVRHSQDLAAKFSAAGVPAASITQENKPDERDKIIAKFEAGEIKVLTSVNVLAVGFDSPIASCAILARPTLSRSLHVQMAGRVIRLFDGKVDAIMLDHAGNVLRHGRVENYSVPPDKHALLRSTDKLPRSEQAQTGDVTCTECGFMHERGLSECPECGHIRTKSVVRVVNGELVEMTIGINELPTGVDPVDVSQFHRKAVRYCRWMGFKTAWAFHKTVDRFGIQGNKDDPSVISLVQPHGTRDSGWMTTSLEQDDLDWLQSAAKSRLDVSLAQVNSVIQSFHIDAGAPIGWQAFSINRMKVDSGHVLKVLICAALSAQRGSRVDARSIANVIRSATGELIQTVNKIAEHLVRKGMATESLEGLVIDIENLPFSRSDRDAIVQRLGSPHDNDITLNGVEVTALT